LKKLFSYFIKKLSLKSSNKKQAVFYYSFLFFVLLYFPLQAQVGKPFIHNYSSKEYKAHVQNWSLTQDKRGIMYIGNGDGILEFDGSTWRLIPIDGKSGVFSFFIDFNPQNRQNEIIYAAGTNTFGYLSPNSQNYLEYNSLRILLDSTLLLDRFTHIIKNKNEIIFYDIATKKMFIIEDSKNNKGNKKIDTLSFQRHQWKIDVGNQLYFWDRPDGIRKIVNKKMVSIPINSFYTSHIPDFVIPEFNEKGKTGNLLIYAREIEILEDKSSKIINTKLYRVATKDFETAIPQDVGAEYPKFTEFLTKINYFSSSYSKIKRLSSGEIIIWNRDTGIYLLDKNGGLQQNINEENGLQTNAVYDMMVTDKDNLFVAMSKGVAHVEIASPVSFWDKNSGLNGVVEAMQYYENKMYVATHQGLYYLEGDRAKKINGDTPLNTQTWCFTRFTPISKDGTPQKEQLLVSDNNGIHQLTDSTAKIKVKNISPVFDFYQSKKSPNRIFLMTGEGLNAMRYENGKWINEEKIKDLKDDIRMMQEDKDGNIWLGTFRNGAIKIPYYENPEEITANKIKYYKESEGLPSLKNTLVYTFKDNLIFATEKGLYKYDKKNDKMIPAPELVGTTLTDGSRDIFSFVEDNNGNLWYAGLQNSTGSVGIARKQADGKYQLYETPFKKIPEMMVLAHYLAPDGTMWFGGSEGLFRYDPKRDTDYYKARNILIRKVQIGKDSVIYGGYAPNWVSDESPTNQPIIFKEHLPYHLNSLTFEFALPSYGEGQNKYRYRLKGFSNEWTEWTTDSKAVYTNLFEGEYTFEVEGMNNYGKTTNLAAYSFHINPPLYRTWYAYIFYGLLAIGVVWLAVKWNGRRLEKEKENLEAIVQQRTAEIQQQKEEIEQQANNVMLANAEINQQKEEIEAQAESLIEANLSITEQNEEIYLQKEEVEKSYKNIKVLSEIGQKITQILNQKDLVKTVYNNVNSLMPAEFFGIGLYNPQLQRIEFFGFIENNEEMPFHYDRLEEKESKAVVCFTLQKEIIENDFLAYLQRKQEEKGEEFVTKVGQIPQSFVYLPLFVEQKPVGVITVQSLEKDAYKEQQLTILRTLAAYTSIALDNVSAYQTIEEKNRNITDSIRYANTIQGAVLPHQNEFAKLFNEHFILYNPKDIVSGDFYWLAQKKGITYLAVIDCTGHGVPGAFMSMIGHSILTEVINEIPKSSPAKILEEMNDRLVMALHQNQESNSDGMDMCLCAFHTVASAESETIKIEYAGAKRNLYYALPNPNSQIEILTATRRSIGGKRRVEKPFENNEINVPKGTTFYLTTDGYVDQNNPNGEKIGTLQFLEILNQISDKPLAEQHLYLINFLDTFQKTNLQRDDITIVGIRI